MKSCTEGLLAAFIGLKMEDDVIAVFFIDLKAFLYNLKELRAKLLRCRGMAKPWPPEEFKEDIALSELADVSADDDSEVWEADEAPVRRTSCFSSLFHRFFYRYIYHIIDIIIYNSINILYIYICFF